MILKPRCVRVSVAASVRNEDRSHRVVSSLGSRKLTFTHRGTIAGVPYLGAKAMTMEIRSRAARIILRFLY